DPSLTLRVERGARTSGRVRPLRRFVLDTHARTPLHSRILNDELAAHATTILVGRDAPRENIAALENRARVWRAPLVSGKIALPWVLNRMGREEITSLLVEGGGEVNASFLLNGLAQRVAFFYAPKVVGGRGAFPATGGHGFERG